MFNLKCKPPQRQFVINTQTITRVQKYFTDILQISQNTQKPDGCRQKDETDHRD